MIATDYQVVLWVARELGVLARRFGDMLHEYFFAKEDDVAFYSSPVGCKNLARLFIIESDSLF